MPNEIYHRSNWGESKAEDFGDVYYDHAATNKLYNHSDYYENSDGTDATLKDLNNKASIVLTPTAYSDGSLNTVIPPYQTLSELVTNGDFSNGTNDWETEGNSSIVVGTYEGRSNVANINILNTSTSSRIRQPFSYVSGKKYKVTVDVFLVSGSFRMDSSDSFISGDFVSTSTTGSWVTLSAEIDAISTGSNYIWLRSLSAVSQFYVDNVSVKEIQEADFDFSRGSSATRVNEQGLVEDVQILSGELVQNGDFEQIGSELVTNGNFETDSDWTKGAGWSIANGKASNDGSVSGNDYLINSASTSIVGKTYKVVFTVSDYVQGNLRVRAGQASSTDINANGTYTQYQVSTSTETVRIHARNNFIGSIDNVSVKEVGQNWTFGTGWSIEDGVVSANAPSGNLDQSLSATSGSKYRVTFTISNYVSGDLRWRFTGTSNENGTLRSANGTYTEEITLTNNQSIFRFPATSGVMDIDNVSIVEITDDTDLPRIDYTDGTGSLLLEPQRTNLVTYSEDFSQWSNSGIITVESGYLAPDGSTNAYKITDDAPSNNATSLYLGVGAAADNARTIWAKTVSGTGTVNLCSHNSNTNNLFTVTNEWQRFEVNSASATGVTNFYGVDFRNSGTLTEILIWGAQTEVGDYATSYIVSNSGSATTRSADVANNSGNADLFNDSEGVLYAEIAALANDGTFRSISISSDAGYNNSIMIRYISTPNQVNVITRIGGAINNTSVNVNDITEFNKIAFKYKSEDCVLFINGVQVATSAGAFNSSGINNLSFDRGGGSANFYGKTKALAVFKEALSNDLLERLTGEGYESFRLLAEANNYTII